MDAWRHGCRPGRRALGRNAFAGIEGGGAARSIAGMVRVQLGPGMGGGWRLWPARSWPALVRFRGSELIWGGCGLAAVPRCGVPGVRIRPGVGV